MKTKAMCDFLPAALRYSNLGWAVMPLEGKHPLTEHGLNDGTTDAGVINGWAKRWPKANIGLPTGRKFWVLDIDTKTGGDLSLEELVSKNGRLPDTIQQQTGTGGRHYLFALPQFAVKNSVGKVAPGIDIRGIGGYIVAAPSIHPDTGREYVWDGLAEIENQPLLAAPDWLLAKIRELDRTAGGLEPVPAKIPKGQQHSTLVSIAGSMRNRGLEFQEIFAALRVVNEQRCTEPGPIENIRKIAESICRYSPGKIHLSSAAPQEMPAAKQPEGREPEFEFHTPKDIIQNAGGLLAYLDSKQKRGLLTPWMNLNRLTHGFHPDELVVLAAGTSKGKTAMALNIAFHAAKNRKGVAIFSMEMSESEVNDRLLCLAGPMDSQVLRKRIDEKLIEQAADVITELPLFVMDRSSVSVKNVHQAVLALAAKASIALVVVDYLQLMMTNRKYGTRAEEVASITRGLKRVAQELHVPLLALSQLNRTSGREKRVPELFDLRESGSIENDANVVLFIHSEREYKEVPDPVIPVDLIIAKQRNGPSGVRLPMLFRVGSGRFEE